MLLFEFRQIMPNCGTKGGKRSEDVFVKVPAISLLVFGHLGARADKDRCLVIVSILLMWR